MKNLIFTILCIAASIPALAADFENIGYTWEEKRKLMVLTEEEKKNPAMILYYRMVQEHKYFDADQSQLHKLNITHKIIKVNSESKIDHYNKVYVRIDAGDSLIEIKARTISPSGVIVELDKSKLKEIKSEQDKNYKIFALEGLEKGSELEFIYKIVEPFSITGREFFQTNIPTKEVDFLFITPKNLKFDFRGYNGFPAMNSDSVKENSRYAIARLSNVIGFEEEQYSPETANKCRVEYKFAYNTANSKGRLYTWADAAQKIHGNHAEFEKGEIKAADKFYKKMNINESASADEKIKTIDNYIKKNIFIQSDLPFTSIETITDKKFASVSAVMRLYVVLLRKANIEFQIGYTTDRTIVKFDDTFDTWNYLSEPLFYFPETKKYLAPGELQYPYGLIPFNFTENKGLFIKTISLGDVETALPEVRFIPSVSSDKSVDHMDVKISFQPEMEKNEFEILRTMTGYSATGTYFSLPYLEAAEKEEFLKQMISYMVAEPEYKELKLLNKDITKPITDTALAIVAKVVSGALIESAGSKTILKLGEVIGQQSELYQEEKRKTDIDHGFNRSYTRKIVVTVPQGYTIKSLDMLKFDITCKDEDKTVFTFRSEYTFVNNVLTVNVFEDYNKITFPQSRYEEFRKVINAATDFNKVKVLIEPI